MFTLILPSYNERENLQVYLPKLEEFFNNSGIKYEIIVVDDDSPDRTWEWVQNYSKKSAQVRVIRRVSEKGLSSAVITGMASATGDILGVMDADMQHDETIIPKMIALLSKVDLVVGSRRTENGSYGEMNLVRRIISYGATLLAKILLPIKTNDPMSGYFLLRKEVFENSKDRLNPSGFKILLEFLAKNPEIQIGEVGYSFRRREYGETKLSGTVMQQYVLALLDLRFGKYFSLQFIKYGLIGFLGVFVNVFGQWFYNEFSETILMVDSNSTMLLPSAAVAFGFEISVFSNFFLNNKYTFKEKRRVGLLRFFLGFLKFNGVSLVGFLIQYSCWFFLLQFFTQYFPNFLPSYITYLANLTGIIIATVSNYQLNRSFTWD